MCIDSRCTKVLQYGSHTGLALIYTVVKLRKCIEKPSNTVGSVLSVIPTQQPNVSTMQRNQNELPNRSARLELFKHPLGDNRVLDGIRRSVEVVGDFVRVEVADWEIQDA